MIRPNAPICSSKVLQPKPCSNGSLPARMLISVRQHHDEDRAEAGAEHRTEPADDDHREILDQHVEVEASTETKPV